MQGFDLNNPKIRLEIAEDVFEKEEAAFARASRLAGESAEDTAWLIGMLHDIGRFEQLSRIWEF